MGRSLVPLRAPPPDFYLFIVCVCVCGCVCVPFCLKLPLLPISMPCVQSLSKQVTYLFPSEDLTGLTTSQGCMLQIQCRKTMTSQASKMVTLHSCPHPSPP